MVANELDLTLACGIYDRTLALANGQVRIPGIKLRYLDLPPTDIFLEMVQFQEYDASEMSLSAHIMLVARGDSPFIGIPVFPSRMFRHSDIFVMEGNGIEKPEDLKGKRIGVPEYHMTANLVIRGLLSDEYGVRAEDVEWVQGGQRVAGREERIDLHLPPEIRLTLERERTIEEMLLAGDVDAIATPFTLDSYIKGVPGVRRLFKSPREAEIDYYQRTGIFPIMHLVVVKRNIHEVYPWVVKRLMNAFVEAKRICFENIIGHGFLPSVVPTFQHDYEDAVKVFGRDFWPYGVEKNRAALEMATRHSYEQGLSDRIVDPEELFAPTTLRAALV